MKKILLRAITFILISIVIYLTIASVLTTIGKFPDIEQSEGGLRFNELFTDNSGLPDLKYFEARDGTETLTYSYHLNTGYAPDNYKKDLQAIDQPLLVIAGTADEAFYADRFEQAISPYTDARVELLQDVSHIGVVVGEEVFPVLKEWLESLNKPKWH